MVVLDELLAVGDPSLLVPLAAVGLAEEAALVGKGPRLEHDEPLHRCLHHLHGRKRLPVGALRRRACSARAAARSLPAAPGVRRFRGVAQAAQTAGWQPGPQRPALRADAVHVWRADLSAAGDELSESLSEQELSRAARFPSPGAGRLWASSRAILRELIARYTDLHPRDVLLHTGRSGRLSLAAHAELCFSLSHSGGLALYAFASTLPVGVDVEAPRDVNEAALARRLLGAGAGAGAAAHAGGRAQERAPAGVDPPGGAPEVQAGGGSRGAAADRSGHRRRGRRRAGVYQAARRRSSGSGISPRGVWAWPCACARDGRE